MVPLQSERAVSGQGVDALLPDARKRESPRHELRQPGVAHLAVHCHVVAREPVERQLEIEIIARGDVEADVEDVALVVRVGPHDVGDAEARHQESAAPAAPHVLKNEREPQDGDVLHVQDGGPGHHYCVVDPLHLSGGEVIVRRGLIAARHVVRGSVEPGRARVYLEAGTAQIPLHTRLLEAGQRVLDGADALARVVAHPLPHHDRALIEQLGIAAGLHAALGLPKGDGLRLQRGPLPLHHPLPDQHYLLCLTEQGYAVAHVARGVKPLTLLQSADDRVRRRKAARGAGGQPQLAGLRRIERSPEGIPRGPHAVQLRLARPLQLRMGVTRQPPQQPEHDYRTPDGGARAPLADQLRDEDPGLVEEQERHNHHQHREDVGRREQRSHHRGEHERQGPMLAEGLRPHQIQHR